MELFSIPWWSALLAIILIDLVLAGDNAIVIALAARKLPPHLQKKAILWGTVGASAVRSLITSGIQKGHMKMHLLNILNQLEATEEEKKQIVEYFKDKVVSFSATVEIFSKLRGLPIESTNSTSHS
jgi:predicted tellurium resistance membrane protein TerC